MTTINSTGVNSGTSLNYQPAKAPTKTLGQDEYLRLMAEELKNQDPLEPIDNKDFLADMAQFSSLEQMNSIAKVAGDLRMDIMALTQQSLLTQGAALIGKEVTGTDLNGETVQGMVTGVKLDGSSLQVQLGEISLDLSQVTEVSTPNK